MPQPDYPITTAIRELRDKNIDFEVLQFKYEEKGGTHQTAQVLEVPEHSVIKTLVMENELAKGLIVLMHGDYEVSTKNLARFLDVKRITPASANDAMKMTGYQFGGTSPFGLRQKLPIYVEESIFDLDYIYINGGKRGLIVRIKTEDLLNVFPDLEFVNVKISV